MTGTTISNPFLDMAADVVQALIEDGFIHSGVDGAHLVDLDPAVADARFRDAVDIVAQTLHDGALVLAVASRTLNPEATS